MHEVEVDAARQALAAERCRVAAGGLFAPREHRHALAERVVGGGLLLVT